MSISVANSADALACDLRFTKDSMHVSLIDGREISVPLEWFPRLANASEKQRKKWRLIGNGIGIHWPDLDEDVSVSALLTNKD